ncbi:hypothetical protein TURU_154755 [Turdus rufiventris]|nr:hypothetical protein TURU_154755 [Turdus rufiventris]
MERERLRALVILGDAANPFHYDWCHLRVGGLVVAAVLSALGIIVLFSANVLGDMVATIPAVLSRPHVLGDTVATDPRCPSVHGDTVNTIPAVPSCPNVHNDVVATDPRYPR